MRGERPAATPEQWAAGAPIKDARPALDPDAPLTIEYKLRLNPYLQDLLERAARARKRKGAELLRELLQPELEAILAEGPERPRSGAGEGTRRAGARRG